MAEKKRSRGCATTTRKMEHRCRGGTRERAVILSASDEDARRISANPKPQAMGRLRSFASLRMTCSRSFAEPGWNAPAFSRQVPRCKKKRRHKVAATKEKAPTKV